MIPQFNTLRDLRFFDGFNDIRVWHQGITAQFQVGTSSRARHSVGTSSPQAVVLWALTAPRSSGEREESIPRGREKKKKTWDFTDDSNGSSKVFNFFFTWWDCIGPRNFTGFLYGISHEFTIVCSRGLSDTCADLLRNLQRRHGLVNTEDHGLTRGDLESQSSIC